MSTDLQEPPQLSEETMAAIESHAAEAIAGIVDQASMAIRILIAETANSIGQQIQGSNRMQGSGRCYPKTKE